MRIGSLQRLDDGRHARAERAFDHDDIAGMDRGQHLRLEQARVLHSRRGGWREEPATTNASADRNRIPD